MAADSIEFADPIIALLEDNGGMETADDFIIHLASLSDVVKNDMRKLLDWDESVIDAKLCDIVAARLDKNGRYRERRGHGTISAQYGDYRLLAMGSNCVVHQTDKVNHAHLRSKNVHSAIEYASSELGRNSFE